MNTDINNCTCPGFWGNPCGLAEMADQVAKGRRPSVADEPGNCLLAGDERRWTEIKQTEAVPAWARRRRLPAGPEVTQGAPPPRSLRRSKGAPWVEPMHEPERPHHRPSPLISVHLRASPAECPLETRCTPRTGRSGPLLIGAHQLLSVFIGVPAFDPSMKDRQPQLRWLQVSGKRLF